MLPPNACRSLGAGRRLKAWGFCDRNLMKASLLKLMRPFKAWRSARLVGYGLSIPLFVIGLSILQALEKFSFPNPLGLKAHSLELVHAEKAEKNKNTSDKNQDILGLVVVDLNPATARKMHLKSKSGVMVQSVIPNGAAENAGLQPKDIIRKINKKKIDSTKDYNKVLREIKNMNSIELVIEREGTELSVNLTMASHGI